MEISYIDIYLCTMCTFKSLSIVFFINLVHSFHFISGILETVLFPPFIKNILFSFLWICHINFKRVFVLQMFDTMLFFSSVILLMSTSSKTFNDIIQTFRDLTDYLFYDWEGPFIMMMSFSSDSCISFSSIFFL